MMRAWYPGIREGEETFGEGEDTRKRMLEGGRRKIAAAVEELEWVSWESLGVVWSSTGW